MPDYRTFFDDRWLKAWDLNGQDLTLTIDRVEAGVIENGKDKSSKRIPVVFFKGYAKPLGLNKTNGKTMAGLFGKDTARWLGKRIILYPTTTEMEGETKDCIRIRPERPADEEADLLARRPDEPAKKKVA
jgi:hypothetical protein